MRTSSTFIAASFAVFAFACPSPSTHSPPGDISDVSDGSTSPVDAEADAEAGQEPDADSDVTVDADSTSEVSFEVLDDSVDSDMGGDEATPDAEPDLPPVCGNGIKEGDEECDDGEANSDDTPDACRLGCILPSCGDGVTDANEACDDANEDPFDGCTSACESVPILPPPTAGQVVITELMVNPSASSDPKGEWIELLNATDSQLNLGTCVLRDEGTDLVAFDDDGAGLPIVVEGGQRLLLGFSSDSAENGGIAPDVVYATMLLDNVADEVILDCDGQIIDSVVYNAQNWPIQSGSSLSLDPQKTSADENDVSFSWCAADTPFGDGDTGTPGSDNTACPEPDTTIDQCVIVSTSGPEAYGFVGRSFELQVVIFELGVTDATSGVDASPDIVVDIGVGPDGVMPQGDADWTWYNGDATEGWSDSDGYDGYVGGFVPENVGLFDVAARVTRDGGMTWTYCDRVDDAVYVADDALQFEVVEDPCEVDACQSPPPDVCLSDGLTLQSYPAVGTCVPKASMMYDCIYTQVPIDCGDQGVACSDGICQGTVPSPTTAGQLIFNELMIDPGVDDYLGEWFEILNVSSGPLNLNGCSLSDGASDFHLIAADVVVGPGKVAVIARSSNPVLNGGISNDYEVKDDIVLDASDALELACGQQLIDALAWTSAWPHGKGVSMALSPYAITAEAALLNDDATSWCGSTVFFGDGSDAGSPGEVNPPCIGDEVPIATCKIVGTSPVTLPAGTVASFAAHISAPGMTDASPGTDASPAIRVEVGVGPVEGALPDALQDWTWTPAQADLSWDASTAGAATGTDGYLASVTIPVPGNWDVAARASADGGNTWTFCDRDGASNGYDTAQAIKMLSEASACSPSPCDAPPATICVGNVVSTPIPGGTCSVDPVDASATCDWEATPIEDCADTAALCVDGACSGGPVAPGVGDVLFTELFIAPSSGSDGEWLELFNASQQTLLLSGCAITTGQGSFSWSLDNLDSALIMPPGGYLVVARSATAITPLDGLFDGIALANAADTIELVCGATGVNIVAYDATWPVGVDQVLALSSTWTKPGIHNQAGKWCSVSIGTPGAANTACSAPDAQVDDCVLLEPVDQTTDAGTGVSFDVAISDPFVTDATAGHDAIDTPGYLVELGWAAVGVSPETTPEAWTWATASPDPGWDDAALPGADGWSGQLVIVEEVGDFDIAARVSPDGGQSWTYCDANGSSNGYSSAAAGSLTVNATSCLPNPCNTPPSPICDGDNVVISHGQGACSDPGTGAECVYPEILFDCAPWGGCSNGSCTDLVSPSVAGELVVSEIMMDSADDGSDEGEFIELYNPGTVPMDLRGCELSDNGSDLAVLGGDAPIVAPAGGFVLLASNADTLTNGGLNSSDIDYVYSGLVLGNVFDQVNLSCNGTSIDSVTWTVGWPISSGVSMSLDAAALTAVANDSVSNWCLSDASYGDGTNSGTPGKPNAACAP